MSEAAVTPSSVDGVQPTTADGDTPTPITIDTTLFNAGGAVDGVGVTNTITTTTTTTTNTNTATVNDETVPLAGGDELVEINEDEVPLAEGTDSKATFWWILLVIAGTVTAKSVYEKKGNKQLLQKFKSDKNDSEVRK